MARQDRPTDFRADFARLLTGWMGDNNVSTIELARHAGINRETVKDAAENRRAIRPETAERIRIAMDEIAIRRRSVTAAEAERPMTDALVLTSNARDYATIAKALRSGTVVLIGADVEVWKCERVK